MSEIQILVNDRIRTVNDQTWVSLDEVIQFLESNYVSDSIIQLKNRKVSIVQAMLELIDGDNLSMLNKTTGEFDQIELIQSAQIMMIIELDIIKRKN